MEQVRFGRGYVGRLANVLAEVVKLPRLVVGLAHDFVVGLSHASPLLGAAFSPDGTRLASGGTETLIRVIRLIDGEVERSLGGHVQTLVLEATSELPVGVRPLAVIYNDVLGGMPAV